MYEELIDKKVKVVLKSDNSFRPIIFVGKLLTEGKNYIKMLDKYNQTQFVKLDQIATLGEVVEAIGEKL